MEGDVGQGRVTTVAVDEFGQGPFRKKIKIFKDILTGSEMFSDQYRVEQVSNGFQYRVTGEVVTPDKPYTGSFSRNQNLVSIKRTEEEYREHLETYEERIIQNMLSSKKTQEDDVRQFKSGMAKYRNSLLKFKTLNLVTGKYTMDGTRTISRKRNKDNLGMLARLEIRENKFTGTETHSLFCFKQGLEEELIPICKVLVIGRMSDFKQAIINTLEYNEMFKEQDIEGWGRVRVQAAEDQNEWRDAAGAILLYNISRPEELQAFDELSWRVPEETVLLIGHHHHSEEPTNQQLEQGQRLAQKFGIRFQAMYERDPIRLDECLRFFLQKIRQVYGIQFTVLSQDNWEGPLGECVVKGRAKSTNQLVAIKLEHKDKHDTKLFREYQIYRQLLVSPDQEGFPKVYQAGPFTENENGLVMELLGPSLAELLQDRKFSLRTVAMIAIQMIDRLEYVHSRGIIHQDLKPENILIGLKYTKQENVIHLIDFGLAKTFIDPVRGGHIPETKVPHPVGNPIYRSINAESLIEQSRRDDLESLGYILMDFFKDDLPWINKEDHSCLDPVTTLQMKQEIVNDDGIPDQLIEFMKMVRGLAFEKEPDYEKLRNLFIELLNKNGWKNDPKDFDWNKKEQEVQDIFEIVAERDESEHYKGQPSQKRKRKYKPYNYRIPTLDDGTKRRRPRFWLSDEVNRDQNGRPRVYCPICGEEISRLWPNYRNHYIKYTKNRKCKKPVSWTGWTRDNEPPAVAKMKLSHELVRYWIHVTE